MPTFWPFWPNGPGWPCLKRFAVVPRRVHKTGEPWPDGIQVLEARSLREALPLAFTAEK